MVGAQTDPSGYTVLEKGAKAPAFVGFAKDGSPFALQKVNDANTLLCFLDPGCEWCKSLLPELNRIHDSLHSSLRIIGITADIDTLRWQAFTADEQPRFRFIVVSKSVVESYKIQANPTLYLLDHKLRIASGRIVRVEELLPALKNIEN